MDFTVVIASRKDTQGLWLTIHSIEQELDRGHRKYEYEYAIVTNDGKISGDLNTLLYHVKQSGKLGFHQHSEEPISAPTARQIATENSQGDVLFFFDSHCLVGAEYFDIAFQDFEEFSPDILHTNTTFYVSDKDHYHYRWKFENGWAESEVLIDNPYKPYKIGAAGHGAFAALKSSWDEIGGYWKGFREYAGEELYISGKAWEMGKTVWLDPTWRHLHYCGDRGYRRHFTDQYYVNNMMTMNIIGGEKYAERVYDHLANETVKIRTDKSMFDLYQEALERSSEHAAWLASVRQRDLDQQLKYFRDNNIPF